MKLSVAERFLRVVTAAAMLMAVVAPSRAEDLSFDGNGTVRILASDWADYLGGSSTFNSANDGGRLFWRGSAGDGNYIHFDLTRLQGVTLTSAATVTLQNTNATWGGGVTDSFIATANGAWSAASGAAVPGATSIADAVNATGDYGSGTSVSWGIGSSTFQGYVNNASSFNGLAIIGGAGSRMHFNGPLNPYLTVATNATMNDVVAVAGGGAWNQSNYSFTDGVLSISGEVAGGQSGAGAVTINSLGTVFVDGSSGDNRYWAVDSTRINAGGMLLLQGHSHLHSLTLAGGELAGPYASGSWGGWTFDDATTVTGSTTSTISARQVNLDNGNFTIDAGSTLNFTGSVRSGAISPTIAVGGKFINGAAPGTSLSLGAVSLNGGELAATSSPSSNLGNYQIRGDVTVGGSSMSTISADVRVVNNEDRTFDVADVDGGSGVDLLVSGRISHHNGSAWGYVTKTGAGTMKVTGENGLGGMTVSAGRLVLEDAGIYEMPARGLTNNAAVEFSVTTGSKTAGGISGSGSLTKTGAGELILAGNNTSTGGLVINGGTVVATKSPQDNGVFSLGPGPITINNGGTLRSTQNWTTGSPWTWWLTVGSITINNGGTWAIDNLGQRVSNGLLLNGGSITGAAENGDWGGLNLASNLTASGSAVSTVAVDTALSGGRTITVDAGSQLYYSGKLHNEYNTNGGITKAGGGTLSLSGLNTYTGVTTFSGGVVNAATFAGNGTASSLGVGTGDTDNGNIGLLFSGGTLQYTGSTAQSTDRAIRLSTDGGGGAIDASGSTPEATLSFTRTSMPNWWANAGSRTLTLKGSNTGANTLAAGIDDIENVTTINVRKEGSGTWVLGGNGTYRGVTDVVGGTLVATNNGSLGIGGLNGATMTWIRDGGSLALQGNISTDEHLHMVGTGVGGAGALRSVSGANTMTQWIALDGDTTVGVDAGTLTLTNRLYGDGAFNASTLTKVGAGTLVLAGENTLTGATVVNGGGLQLNSSLRNSSAITVTGGLLDVAATNVLAADHGTQYNALITIAAGGTVASSNGSVNRIGNVALQGGVLTANTSDGNFGSYYIAQANNADPTVTVSGSIASTINGAGNITMWSNVNFDVADVTGNANADLTISAVLDNRITGDGSARITKLGEGTLSLSGNNTYSGGTTINAGRLVAGHVNAFGAGGITMAAGTVLDLNNLAIANTITNNGGEIVGALSFSGTTAVSSGTATLTNVGGTVDIDQSAVADLVGTIDASVVVKNNGRGRALGQIKKDVAINGGAHFDILDGATIDDAASFAFTNNGEMHVDRTSDLSIGKSINGNGLLKKSGAGRLDLTGDNSQFTGSTAVDGGILSVSGTLGGAVNVNDGGTLKGSGSVFTGLVAIGGGEHSPGNSPGTQTFASGLSYSGSSSLTWELIANTTSDPGTNYDFISVTGGDLTIASGALLSLEFLNTGTSVSTVNWGDSFWDVGRTWTLIDFTSSGSSSGIFTLAGSPSTWLDSASTSLATARPSASFSVANQGGDVVLTYAIVPEPGSIALVGIGVGLAAIAIRRRRSS